MLTIRLCLLLAVSSSSIASGRRTKYIHKAVGDIGSEEPQPATRRIKFLFIRHALSCANMVQEFTAGLGGLAGTWSKNFLRDPMLSECGAHRSQQAGESLEKLVQPDIVLTSSMLRSMETAAYMFPGRTITPVPYISEIQKSAFEQDNIPLEVDKQKAQLKSAVATGGRVNMDPLAKLSSLLDMTWMEDERFAREARTSSSWEYFKHFMAGVFLPSLNLTAAQKGPLTIALVSHSHFLREVPIIKELCSGYYGSKPENNQVLELLFDYDAPIESEMMSLSEASREIDAEGRGRLNPVAGQKCKNPLNVPGTPEVFCSGDVGDVCQAEMEHAFQASTFSWIAGSGKLELHDDKIKEALQKMEQAQERLRTEPTSITAKEEFEKYRDRATQLSQKACCL